ncbi:hypothetical protein MMC13_002455 [Lambiella insularis]|nr:hypothetical protein [Lambiella insularis]
MTDLYRSARLVYRAIESPGDDAFFLALAQDYEAHANSNPRLPRPATEKVANGSRDDWSKSLIGVMICLAHPSPDASGPKGTPPSEKPTPVGVISLSVQPPGMEHHRNSSISLQIIGPYRRQGYGSEAIEWILNWGFQTAGLHRIGIGCFSWNSGALKLYEKLGFVVEGRGREQLWYNGGWGGFVELAMLEDEWRARKITK